MNKIALLLVSCGILSGCIGTKVTGRQTDTNAPHPDLHSVPDRPEPLDVDKIDAERDIFEDGHEGMVRKNQSIRANNKPPIKPES